LIGLDNYEFWTGIISIIVGAIIEIINQVKKKNEKAKIGKGE